MPDQIKRVELIDSSISRSRESILGKVNIILFCRDGRLPINGGPELHGFLLAFNKAVLASQQEFSMELQTILHWPSSSKVTFGSSALKFSAHNLAIK